MRTGDAVGYVGHFHEAGFYASDADFLSLIVPFVAEGVASADPVIIGYDDRKSDLLRRSLPDPSGVTFIADRTLYASPARAIESYRQEFDRALAAGAAQVRIAGDVPHEGNGGRFEGWDRYESAVNAVWQDYPVWSRCLYDATTTPADVRDVVERTHRRLVTPDGHVARSSRYQEVTAFVPLPVANDPLMDRSAPSAVLIDPAPHQAAAQVAREASAIITSAETQQLTSAVHEVVHNARTHGSPPTTVTIWAGRDHVVVAVRDSGPGPPDPLTGLVPARRGASSHGGGLWWISQMEHVDVALTSEDGFTIRLRAGKLSPRQPEIPQSREKTSTSRPHRPPVTPSQNDGVDQGMPGSSLGDDVQQRRRRALLRDGHGGLAHASRRLLEQLRASGYAERLVVAWYDVSGRHHQASAVAAATAQFAAAFEHAPVGMLLIDANRKIMRANDSFAAISGRRVDDLVGLSLDDLLDPRDLADSRSDFARMIAGHEQTYYRERRLLSEDGGARWVSVGVSRVGAHGDVFAVEHIEDIHERKSYEGRLQFLADHDALTGLFNRRRFVEELNQQVARDARYDGNSAVMIVDLDNFKYINDTLGHATGDQILEVIARALRQRLRDSDVIGRLGGDEFAVLLPGADRAQALAVATTLLDAIRASEVEHAEQRVRTTGSIGVRVTDIGAARVDDILADADLALYAAKDAGRNTAVLHDPRGPHAERARSRFVWLDRIRSALEHDQFVLESQPIVDLNSGAVTGCELLVRLQDGHRLVPPATFLPIAERHGLANRIDRLVVAHGIEIASQQRQSDRFRWEINLSADSLGDPGIVDLVESQLRRTGLPAPSLAFEITETAAITNLDLAQTFAATIAELGCQIALDDFGAGYASLYYFKHLQFAHLKIDGEFIRQLTTNSVDRAIVRAIVSAAMELEKRTIAECVEDAQTLDLLRSYRVDEAQGYYIGRPGDPRRAVQGVPRLSGTATAS